jgi:hypothetical protein
MPQYIYGKHEALHKGVQVAATDADLRLRRKHNKSEMVAVLGPYVALPYYIHTYIGSTEGDAKFRKEKKGA